MNKIIGHKQTNKGVVPEEHEEQKTFCKFLDVRKIKYFAVPNGSLLGGKNKFAQANKLKAEGVKKGVPDMVVFLNNKILFVEMKRRKGGTVSKEQKAWIEYINTLPYAEAVVCKGAVEAMEMIRQ